MILLLQEKIIKKRANHKKYLVKYKTDIFATIMGYAKERGKLEQLSAKLVGLNIYNEKSLAALDDIHEKYSHTVRILKNKEPETFIELYKNELQEVKNGRKALKESDTVEARQNSFVSYKDTVSRAIENTIKATLASL